MDIVNACAERDSLGGGRYQSVLHIKPIAYLNGGTYYRSSRDWANGDATFPHVVTAAPMMVYTAADGMRRICPTRETDRYVEIGAPLVKVAGVWTKPNFGAATRDGNRLTWHNPNADMSVTMAGHYLKADIELLGGYIPADRQFAFPVGMSGLTRDGGRILRDGVEVMHLRAPDLYDAANPEGERLPIAWQFVTVGGNPYILFTLPEGVAGMARPVVDPTFDVQPDASAGKDTYIQSGSPTYARGTDTTVILGGSSTEKHPVLQFDLSSLAGATIVSGTMSLYKTANSGTYTAFDGYVYRMTRAWTEGTSGFGTGANWNTYDGTNAWTSAGGDFDATAEGYISVTNTLNVFFDWDIGALVQEWVSGTTNAGAILRKTGDTSEASFASSDNATASYRPKLTVVYTTGSRASYRSLLGVGW